MNTEISSPVVIDDNPPPLSITLKTLQDLPRPSKQWKDVKLPVDILLLTVKDCEFLSCYNFLKNSFKSNNKNLGYVYFGEMGGDQSSKLRVALIRCSEGSTVPGGSVLVIKNAVTKLRPKAVFSVGLCHGLQRSKTKLGDVVVSAKLTQYAPKSVKDGNTQPTGATRVPVGRDVSHLIKHAADGWRAPLVNPSSTREIQVHCDGEYLSGPEKIRAKSRCEELVKLYPEAIAIEMEGEGVYVAAYDMKMEWVVVKGVSGYADGTGCESEEWMSFASAMAASLVENILFDAHVFQSWPNYKEDEQIPREEFLCPMGVDVADEQMPADEPCVESPCPMTVQITVKKGIPSREDLESISQRIAEAWKPLGRRLNIDDSKLTAFHKENEEYAEKPYQMLLHWKEKEGVDATYKVLYDALCHPLVKRKDLAQTFCCD